MLLDEAHRRQDGILLAGLLGATEGTGARVDAAVPGAAPGPAGLTADGQVRVVEALLLVLEGLYTHLPL